MRRLVLLIAIATAALPAIAAKPVTVAQLVQALAAAQGRPDAEVAQQLSDLQLTERLNADRFAKLKAALPGEMAQQALTALADSSEFLNLPTAEIPSMAAPDPAAQRQMMSLVVNYVTKTTHQLPNFFAARETARFEDNPHFAETPMQLHFVAKSSKTVFYRDGKEMVNTAAGKAKAEGSETQGLVSWGEFGPILSTVLLDAAQSTLAWSHWEQGAGGPVAVFSYAVPGRRSHYLVRFCCVMDEAGLAQAPFSKLAVYHGEMGIDPATGAILRITSEADFEQGSPVTRAAIMVEYRDEEIGGKSFTCPVRSVAISVVQPSHASNGVGSILNAEPHKTYLNDVVFGQYHRLGSETRVLTADGGEPETNPPALGSEEPGSPGLQPLPGASTEPHIAPETGNSPASAPAGEASKASAPVSTAAPPLTAAPAPSATQAVIERPAGIDSDRSGQATASNQDQIPVLRANAHDVVVDVVVTKGDGEPVLALGRQVFEVLEDGKPQPLDYFEEHTGTESHDAPEQQLPPNMFTNAAVAPQGDSVNVLLIDHLNTPLQDQRRVHEQILDFLTKMQPGTRIAVFVLGSKLRLIQTFTADGAVLGAALNDKKAGDSPETIAASRSRQDDADDQAANEKHAMMMGAKQSILGGFGDSGSGGPGAALSKAAGNQGGERVAMTVEALEHLARYLAGIPGRKNLLWFSTSFPISVFPSVKEQQAHPEGHGYDQAIRETAGLLTLSKVAVYPVSAEGLQMDNATEANVPTQTNQEALYQQADVRAIRTEALNKLAADTGGKAFYNTNDLAGAMARAIDDGAHYYTLVYSPANTKMDGSYRRIEVKLTEGRYDLAYRHGYFADDKVAAEPKQSSDPLHPFLVRGVPSSTQILLRVRVVPANTQPEPGGKPGGENTALAGPLTRDRVEFSIRSTDVDLEPGPNGKYSGRIQIGLLAYDVDGNALNWAGGTMAIDASAETYAAIQRTGIPAHLEIDLPKTAAYLEAGVFDWNTRKVGTLEIPIHPETAVKPDAAPPGFLNQEAPGGRMGTPGNPQR
jgi:VWFA-related protein